MQEKENIHVPRIGGRRSVAAGEPFNLVVILFHEMTKEHYIKTIALGDGERNYVVVEFFPEVSYPQVSFPVVLEKTTDLKFHVCCNKHGSWQTIWPVEVTK